MSESSVALFKSLGFSDQNGLYIYRKRKQQPPVQQRKDTQTAAHVVANIRDDDDERPSLTQHDSNLSDGYVSVLHGGKDATTTITSLPSNAAKVSLLDAMHIDTIPHTNLLMYTPGAGGMVDLGAFGGAAFLQPGYALGQALRASSKVCGETCRVNPSCAVAVFGGGECVLAGMKPTNLGVSVSFFTGEKCGDEKGVCGAVMSTEKTAFTPTS
ncbi:hypothetical protein HDU78_009626 [Chytriomyces hyalinus]|nr:hypothetical protein HDU78_009626 [Chytriomyces hyalinus]